jgi:hypothetical protein
MSGSSHLLLNNALGGDAAGGLASLFALTAGPRNLPEESDALLARILGPDLQGATLRSVLYLAVAAAMVATIVVLI